MVLNIVLRPNQMSGFLILKHQICPKV